MTALRPERDSSGAPDGENVAHGDSAGDAHGDAGAFAAAVDDLADPLTDPLPGQHPSPWFRSGAAAEPQIPQEPQAQEQPQEQPQEQEWYDPEGYVRDWYGPQAPQAQRQAASPQPPMPEPTYEQLYGAYAPEQPTQAYEPIPDDETVGLRTADTRRIAEPEREPEPDSEPERPTEGRAARRKAAKKGGGAGPPPRPTSSGAPLSRLEARRAERARRPSPGAVLSRGIGELFITVGVLMLLFVTYQLWWTNIRAHQQANSAAHELQDDWAKGKGKPGSFEPGQGFALLHIPKLDVVVPVAEGIDKQRVLDRGMVGHYNEGSTKTPMPDAKQGNFAVAGHRNTHGEPFRYINRLEPGDPIVVETQDKYFVYKMASILPQTSPGNTGVIGPVPPGSGFTKPGRYITLTTCTPEFTSKYRMIVWGKMVEERPRGKGKPSVLVN
ncbi:class E sortase [Streptomyces kanamyceticus]|uniref:Class E sortase n=1 Tax=Streptomyces kanamyceticus TaxID=1967 RepID=A0A5J6GC59_STRKN|nr:class E sortase [Streptomyces kanamyceticus]QEU93089.1 class E sortase [Streptomyces kanamyceticus]